ncbi:MAG: hypothetical protein GY934_11430, partial [Gammaproteobacteria bacterium]|nr:hypothetical protein [Gammaproteobacteria bacterium]
MLQKKEQKLYVMIITIGLMLAVLWASPGWPTLQSKADLPLLDPPVVAPADDNNDDNDDNNNNNNTPLLAHIELFVSPTPIGVEAAVQWQNINGAWEDVGGWSHPLENG